MSTVVPEETLNTNIEASDNSKEEEASKNEASVEGGAAKGESAESGNESVDKKKKPKKKADALVLQTNTDRILKKSRTIVTCIIQHPRTK